MTKNVGVDNQSRSDFKSGTVPSVSDPCSLNLDPAKNLNSVPVPDQSYFLPLSEFFLNYFIIIRFSHQKKSIE